jgi:hypothetical protein
VAALVARLALAPGHRQRQRRPLGAPVNYKMIGPLAGSPTTQLPVAAPFRRVFIPFVTVSSSTERILIAINVSSGHC